MNRVSKKVLLGMGFDNKDGHVRVTKGKNFALLGGSDRTHCEMQEKAIKLNECLAKRRKTLDDVSEKELCDIADDIGLKIRKEK
jgi:hypothetical protein